MVDCRRHHVAIDAVHHPYAGQCKANQCDQRSDLSRRARTQVQFTNRTHLQIGCALSDDHRHAHHAGQQTKRIQQLEEVTGVVKTHVFVQVERYALQQVTERHADHQRWNEATDEDAPVPHVAPTGVFNLGTVVETDRTEE